MFRVLLFFVSFLLLGTLQAAEEPRFQEGNEAYQASNFEKSIELFESLINDGYRSTELFYNLGNAYYRTEKLGKAILNYERALVADPHNEDARYNLNLARSNIKDPLTELPPFFLARWWSALRQLLSANGWAVVTLCLLWIGIAGLIVWLLARARNYKKQGFITGVVLLTLCIIPFALALDKAGMEEHSGRAILLTDEIALRSAPDGESAALLPLYEGTKLELLDVLGEWTKVRLINGEQGWLPTETFEEI